MITGPDDQRVEQHGDSAVARLTHGCGGEVLTTSSSLDERWVDYNVRTQGQSTPPKSEYDDPDIVVASHSISDPVRGEEQPIAEPEARVIEGNFEKVGVKLIFLDMDGPIAPYVDYTFHLWEQGDSFGNEPYAWHVEALKCIVDLSGGPEVVKVVLSSNWRTHNERARWLEAQFDEYGIDMIGHTDVVHVQTMNTSVGYNNLTRAIEIHRVLEYNVLGRGGPYLDETDQVHKLTPWRFPVHWEVKAWIAIDDLSLDAVSHMRNNPVRLLQCFINDASETPTATRWFQLSRDVLWTMSAFFEHFEDHFVWVDAHEGLGGTPGAIETAIKLLTANDNPTSKDGSVPKNCFSLWDSLPACLFRP